MYDPTGGGCYSEYFNLQDLLAHKASSVSGGAAAASHPAGGTALTGGAGGLKSVIYGGSEMLSATNFLKQLAQLGAAPKQA